MKIYTKTGDKGQTSLFSGKRVSKAHKLVEAYGTLDELNTVIGFLRSSLSDKSLEKSPVITEIQNQIFSVGSFCASEGTSADYLRDVFEWTAVLEQEMDQMNETLPGLKNFILPGGSASSCWAHQCRVTTRKAERFVVALEYEGEDWNSVVIYLNRLSDYFFMFARYMNFLSNVDDPIWVPK